MGPLAYPLCMYAASCWGSYPGPLSCSHSQNLPFKCLVNLLLLLPPPQLWLHPRAKRTEGFSTYFQPLLPLLRIVPLATSEHLQQESCWFPSQPCPVLYNGEAAIVEGMVGAAPGKKASLYSKCVNFFVSKYFSIVICLCLVSKDLKWLFFTILSCVTVIPLGDFLMTSLFYHSQRFCPDRYILTKKKERQKTKALPVGSYQEQIPCNW